MTTQDLIRRTIFHLEECLRKYNISSRATRFFMSMDSTCLCTSRAERISGRHHACHQEVEVISITASRSGVSHQFKPCWYMIGSKHQRQCLSCDHAIGQSCRHCRSARGLQLVHLHYWREFSSHESLPWWTRPPLKSPSVMSPACLESWGSPASDSVAPDDLQHYQAWTWQNPDLRWLLKPLPRPRFFSTVH